MITNAIIIRAFYDELEKIAAGVPDVPVATAELTKELARRLITRKGAAYAGLLGGGVYVGREFLPKGQPDGGAYGPPSTF